MRDDVYRRPAAPPAVLLFADEDGPADHPGAAGHARGPQRGEQPAARQPAQGDRTRSSTWSRCFALSWRLTLIALVLAPVLAVTLAPIVRRLKRGYRQAFDQQGELVSMLQEAVSGVRLIKASGAEDYERDRFAEPLRALHAADGAHGRPVGDGQPAVGSAVVGGGGAADLARRADGARRRNDGSRGVHRLHHHRPAADLAAEDPGRLSRQAPDLDGRGRSGLRGVRRGARAGRRHARHRGRRAGHHVRERLLRLRAGPSGPARTSTWRWRRAK